MFEFVCKRDLNVMPFEATNEFCKMHVKTKHRFYILLNPICSNCYPFGSSADPIWGAFTRGGRCITESSCGVGGEGKKGRKGSEIDQNGSKMETKIGPKCARGVPRELRRNRSRIKASTPGKAHAPFRDNGGKGRPKGAFLEIPKIENGTEMAQWRQDRHRDPPKTVSWSYFEKNWKISGNSIGK
jgi:hypothetical protein